MKKTTSDPQIPKKAKPEQDNERSEWAAFRIASVAATLSTGLATEPVLQIQRAHKLLIASAAFLNRDLTPIIEATSRTPSAIRNLTETLFPEVGWKRLIEMMQAPTGRIHGTSRKKILESTARAFIEDPLNCPDGWCPPSEEDNDESSFSYPRHYSTTEIIKLLDQGKLPLYIAEEIARVWRNRRRQQTEVARKERILVNRSKKLNPYKRRTFKDKS